MNEPVRSDLTEAERNELLQRKIDDASLEGWKLQRREGDRAILVRRTHGSKLIHALLLIFTMGIGNVFYWPYAYYGKADKRAIRAVE